MATDRSVGLTFDKIEIAPLGPTPETEIKFKNKFGYNRAKIIKISEKLKVRGCFLTKKITERLFRSVFFVTTNGNRSHCSLNGIK